MTKVVILQHRLLHYRTGLFDLLHERCRGMGIDIHLVHGQPTAREARKNDTGYLPWADQVKNRHLSIGRRDVLWQPYPDRHRDANLVVIMQENRLLSNYPWLFRRGGDHPRLAYWGHGRNFQATRPGGVLENWKKLLVGRVDWWFAYTDKTRDILLDDGFPSERITVLNNAIDNVEFERHLASVEANDQAELRCRLGIPHGSPVALFCGSLYADKRLGFMICAADQIRRRIPSFHLIVVGDGPSAGEIQQAGTSRPWLHSVGAHRGRDKARFFRLADIIFNPGAVGLHVLDAFCAGIPMVTTEDARHGPEIAYLANGHNGLVVEGSPDTFANAVIDLLSNPERQRQLSEAAKASGKTYTLDAMVTRFAEGISTCLETVRK